MDSGRSLPKVSICCLAYNHFSYIEKAIIGFLSQKVDFPLEILIHDDASEDGTTEIIKKYREKFPDLIKCIFQTENIYSKGINPLAFYLLPLCRGKYIALCEGDDYWTDPYKLQKQVEILETHQEYSMCFTARNVVDRKGNFIREERYPNKIYKTKDVVDGFIPSTQTILMRNYPDLINFRKKNSTHPSGDRLMTYYCSLMGDIYYLDEITACYRESGEGVWSSFNYWQKREVSFDRYKAFHNILGFGNNNLTLLQRGVYEYFSKLFSLHRKPLHLINNIIPLYKKYLEDTSVILVIAIIMIKLKRKILKLVKL